MGKSAAALKRREQAAIGRRMHADGVLPTTSNERKDIPLARGVLDYFPAALAAVAGLSRAGNEKHNPGEEMHHARGKSMDHADCIMRHLVDRGTVDPEDGILHSVKVAWRALALLQEELEAVGAPLARGAKLPEDEPKVTYPQIPLEVPEPTRAIGCCDTPCKACKTNDLSRAFSVETDPNGVQFRRTGERRALRRGDYYLGEANGSLGHFFGPAARDYDQVATIVKPVEAW